MADTVVRSYFSGEIIYSGPDHSTPRGAGMLAARLSKYWQARGFDITYEAYPTDVYDTAGFQIFGVRRLWSIPRVDATPEPDPMPRKAVGLTPRARIRRIVTAVLDRNYPSVSYGDVMSPIATREVVAARASCIRAVLESFPHMSLPHLGQIFGRDHTSILNLLGGHKPAHVAA